MSDEINGTLKSAGQSILAAAIRRAIGATDDEEVSFYAPPHASRMDGKEVTYYPFVREEFDALRSMPRQKLIQLGLRPWDESGLLLFPMEWYGLIPDGFEIVDIFGATEAFRRGETDDDCRFGVLAYGIVVEEE